MALQDVERQRQIRPPGNTGLAGARVPDVQQPRQVMQPSTERPGQVVGRQLPQGQPEVPTGQAPGRLTPTVAKPPNTNVTQRTTDILRKDSPLMKRAETAGLQAAHERGLLNSSIAVGSAQAAVIDQAIRLAQADGQMELANWYAGLDQQKFETDVNYRERVLEQEKVLKERALTQQDRQLDLQQRQQEMTFTQQAFYRDLDAKKFQADDVYRNKVLEQERQFRQKDMEFKLAQHGLDVSRLRMQERSAVFDKLLALENAYNQKFASIMSNPEIGADARTQYLNLARTEFNQAVKLLTNFYKVPPDWGPQFGGTALLRDPLTRELHGQPRGPGTGIVPENLGENSGAPTIAGLTVISGGQGANGPIWRFSDGNWYDSNGNRVAPPGNTGGGGGGGGGGGAGGGAGGGGGGGGGGTGDVQAQRRTKQQVQTDIDRLMRDPSLGTGVMVGVSVDSLKKKHGSLEKAIPGITAAARRLGISVEKAAKMHQDPRLQRLMREHGQAT